MAYCFRLHISAFAWLCIASVALAQTTAVDVVTRIGMCDASAGVALGKDRFLVANDEDNFLRIYRQGVGAEPLQAFDAAAFLRIDSEHPEADIEGATAVGNRVYWITSHGRNKEGKDRPNRYRFFATQWEPRGERIAIFFAGNPYLSLLEDLLRDNRLTKYDLSSAALRAPKSIDALNIEGLCTAPDGASLWIGFRNPIVDGKALIVPLENPSEAIDGKRARLGDPIELDLDGRGIRSIDYWPERREYLIVGGDHDQARRFAAYLWSGKTTDSPRKLDLDFGQLNPEGIVLYPDEAERFQILSDDGTKMVDGYECKDNPDVRRRSFRTAWFALPQP